MGPVLFRFPIAAPPIIPSSLVPIPPLMLIPLPIILIPLPIMSIPLPIMSMPLPIMVVEPPVGALIDGALVVIPIPILPMAAVPVPIAIAIAIIELVVVLSMPIPMVSIASLLVVAGGTGGAVFFPLRTVGDGVALANGLATVGVAVMPDIMLDLEGLDPMPILPPILLLSMLPMPPLSSDIIMDPVQLPGNAKRTHKRRN
mmetsp:Transcript_21170/g.44256  ORF Transcript_21170/g.44256 Transcript_21170/m.44256 type:complete len:201 (-) Transcript_21170:106-708(-)